MGDIVGGRGLKETEEAVEVEGGLRICSLLNEGERNFVQREGEMILEEDFQAMQVLKRQGLKKRKVAELLGLDRKTIQKYWEKADGVCRKQGRGKRERLEPYREYLLKRAPETDDCAAVLFLDLKRLGYEGCYETVKVFIRPLLQGPASPPTQAKLVEPPPQRSLSLAGFKPLREERKRRRFVLRRGLESRRKWILGVTYSFEF